MNKKETIKTVQHLVKAVYPHYDRITFIADADVNYLDLKKLSNPNPKLKPAEIWVEKTLSGKKYRILLFQPKRANLEYLAKATQNEPVFVHANRVEITYDFISKYDHVALSDLIARHTVVTQTHEQHYNCYNGTHYWGYRENNKMYPVLYCDRKSKIVGKRCAHYEFRLRGKSKCEEHQLVSPASFLNFDFYDFFIKNSKFYTVPNKAVIGEFIGQAVGQHCKSRRGNEKLFDRIAESDFDLCHDSHLQKMMNEIPGFKKYFNSSRKIQQNNVKFTQEFQQALLKNVQEF